MSFILADRVKESSISSGLGDIVFNGVFGGFQSFLSAIGDGNSTFYTIENELQWEVGVGTYSLSTNSLSRDAVLDSSNSGNKINLNGVSVVFCTYPALRAPYFNNSNFLDLLGRSGILFSDNTQQSTAFKPSERRQKTISSDYTLTFSDEVVFVDCSTSDVNINIPLASGVGGREFSIKRKPGGNFSCTISSQEPETVDGESTISLYYDYEAISLISDDKNWLVL